MVDQRDQTTGNLIHKMAGYKNYISSVGFSPNGNHVVSGSKDNTLRIWDVASGKEFARGDGPWPGSTHHVAWTPDGRFLLSGAGPSSPVGVIFLDFQRFFVANFDVTRLFLGAQWAVLRGFAM